MKSVEKHPVRIVPLIGVVMVGLGILGAPMFLLIAAAFHPGAEIGAWVCGGLAVVGYGVVQVSKRT